MIGYTKFPSEKSLKEAATLFNKIRHQRPQKKVNIYTTVDGVDVPLKWLYFTSIRKRTRVHAYRIARIFRNMGYNVYSIEYFPSQEKCGIKQRNSRGSF